MTQRRPASGSIARAMARSLLVRFEDGSWVVKRGRKLVSRHLAQEDAIDLAMAEASEAGLTVDWTNALGEAWRTTPARGGWFSTVLRATRIGSRVHQGRFEQASRIG